MRLTLASLAFVWFGAFLGALAAGFPSPALFAREKEMANDQRGAFLGPLAAGFPSPALFAREKVPIA